MNLLYYTDQIKSNENSPVSALDIHLDVTWIRKNNCKNFVCIVLSIRFQSSVYRKLHFVNFFYSLTPSDIEMLRYCPLDIKVNALFGVS